MTKWTIKDISDLSGRSMIVTGTGGIGFKTALALARAGAEVIVAGRNPVSGAEAVKRIRGSVPRATVAFEQLDLGDLSSISAFGEKLRATRESLHVLINNAGVMAPPAKRLTSDGFELQFGTNFLGHFALTAQLLPLLRKVANPRVVSLGSVAANGGAIDFQNLNGERAYKPMVNYSQSKLACIMFAFELQRRSDAAGWGLQSLAAHPGISRSDLIPNSAGRWEFSRLIRTCLPFLFQPVAQGALPSLYAATSPEAQPGGYYGPDRLAETRGHPAPAKIVNRAKDQEVAARLWSEAERLAGLSFDHFASWERRSHVR